MGRETGAGRFGQFGAIGAIGQFGTGSPPFEFYR